MSTPYDALFQPVSIGSLTLRNRIIMTAMSTRFPGTDGKSTEQLLNHYTRRAQGGAAMLTVELADPHPYLRHLQQALWNYNDAMIPDLRKIVDAIHSGGAAASIQIGAYFRSNITSIAHHTSSLQSPEAGPMSIELNEEEIQWITKVIADASWRCKEAGFDAVELRCIHGDILEEFFSPYWNKRTDKYGGSLENRMRFPLEVLDATRARVGSSFPIIYRICGTEFHPDGTTVADAVAFSLAAQERGLDAVNLTGGIGHIDHLAIASSYEARGMLIPSARAIKAETSIPVILANSLTPELALDAVVGGSADIIGLGRPLLTDPDWPLKVSQGRVEAIRPCVRCNQGCMGGLRKPGNEHISCLSNPQLGKIDQDSPKPTATPKKICVIGGGLAGCETALVAAQRGHQVTLYEQENVLGGQFRIAGIPPGKADFAALIRFFEHELPRLGVTIHLGTKADPALVAKLAPDCIVLATGAVPVSPPIPGLNLPHVHHAVDVLKDSSLISPQGPVVVLGGGATGLETAHYLAEKGHAVTVVDLLLEAGKDMVHSVGVRERLLGLLKKDKVALRLGLRILAVDAQGVQVSSRVLSAAKDHEHIPAASVVVALGTRPRKDLEQELAALPIPLFMVGDCTTPRNALLAMQAGYALGLEL